MYQYILLIIAVILVSYIGLGILAKYYLYYCFCRKISGSRKVYLTFDDGPDAAVTPKILDLLEGFGIRATFFLSGENILRHPELVKRIIESEHDIGGHGYNHIHPWRSGPVKTLRDIYQIRKVFRSLGERGRTALYRPPYGKLNLVQLLCWLWMGQRLVFWTLDPRDYRGRSGAQVGREVLDRLVPGSVVLLHDSRRGPDSDGRVTVEALRLILEEAQEREFSFATIGELYGEEGY